MLVDSNILPECIVRPGSFGGLMALYEANFIKFRHLVTDLDRRSGAAVSSVADDCDLHLAIRSRTKYTCEIGLTYLFEEPDGPVADPDLVARVYFDARIAEVTGWINAHRHELLRYLTRRYGLELDLCWSRNTMLGKWLDYLVERGHRFGPPARAPVT